MEMKDNKFFAFVEEYRADIEAFINALVELIKTLFASDEAAE